MNEVEQSDDSSDENGYITLMDRSIIISHSTNDTSNVHISSETGSHDQGNLKKKLIKDQKKNLELEERIEELNENLVAMNEQVRRTAQESLLTYELHD